MHTNTQEDVMHALNWSGSPCTAQASTSSPSAELPSLGSSSSSRVPLAGLQLVGFLAMIPPVVALGGRGCRCNVLHERVALLNYTVLCCSGSVSAVPSEVVVIAVLRLDGRPACQRDQPVAALHEFDANGYCHCRCMHMHAKPILAGSLWPVKQQTRWGQGGGGQQGV